jgi:flavin-dependent dehydrogenase
MLNRNREIRIAGAGPAGLASSIILAKAGLKVRVFEQHSKVGSRFHDDFQGLENWSREEDALEEVRSAGIETNWWYRTFYGGKLCDPDMRPATIKCSRPFFYMVRRGFNHPRSLDLALLDQARELGVEVVWNQRLDPESAHVVASGPQGVPLVIARGMTFDTVLEDQACVILNDDLAPSGYVYFLVGDGRATLATVLFEKFHDARDCLSRSQEAIRKLFGIDGFQDAKYWGGYGLFSIPKSCERNGSLWVGEAAGFQDLLFGFGIRNALVSAKLAAQSIIEDRSYNELWKERLLPHLQASVVSRAIYKGFGDLAMRALWYATGSSSRPERIMRCLYTNSPVHRILFPAARTGLERG